MLSRLSASLVIILFFLHDTATTEIYTLSLHDALPISVARRARERVVVVVPGLAHRQQRQPEHVGRLVVDVEPPRAEEVRSEEHTSELQSRRDLVCRLLLEKKKKKRTNKERVT